MITVVVMALVDDVDVAIPTDDHSELFVRCSTFDTFLTAQTVGVHAGFPSSTEVGVSNTGLSSQKDVPQCLLTPIFRRHLVVLLPTKAKFYETGTERRRYARRSTE